MNVLFLTLSQFESVNERGIYTDLIREFTKHGHDVYAISPIERRQCQNTHIIEEDNAKILRLKIGNTQKTNIIEKGISTVLIEPQFILAIKKYYADVKFDLILYSTPPITFNGAVAYVKKRDNAKTYLLLKDIFPQNAVDIGMMSKTGVKGLLYKHFRQQEKKLYAISDRIGCMSQANVEYILRHNKELKTRNERVEKNTGRGIVEVCPNSIEPVDMSLTEDERKKVRKKYGIPQDRTVFVYGGNLGKPQGIDHMLKCLHSQRENIDVFFLIVGNGTEYPKIERYVEKYKPDNIALRRWLPKEDYDKVVASCDVGMIFLDHRFTIPNFPSRLLSYMQAKLPVLAVTDPNTDIGNVITGIDKDGRRTHEPFGWWCESNNNEAFAECIGNINKDKMIEKGYNAYKYLEEQYDVSKQIKQILFGSPINIGARSSKI